MLNARYLRCEDVRNAFEPRVADEVLEAHRHACLDCDAWATKLDALVTGESSRVLPGRLRDRLRAIGDGVICGDTERLYTATRRKAHAGADDPAVEEHLESCARCAAIYGALGTTFDARPRPLPAALRDRLVGLVARPEREALPWWVRDKNLAVAASALLTFTLSLFGGEATALVQSARLELSSRATEVSTEVATTVAAEGEVRRRALLEVKDNVETAVATGLAEGRARLDRAKKPPLELWQKARRQVGIATWDELTQAWLEPLEAYVPFKKKNEPSVDSETSEDTATQEKHHE